MGPEAGPALGCWAGGRGEDVEKEGRRLYWRPQTSRRSTQLRLHLSLPLERKVEEFTCLITDHICLQCGTGLHRGNWTLPLVPMLEWHKEMGSLKSQKLPAPRDRSWPSLSNVSPDSVPPRTCLKGWGASTATLSNLLCF